MSLLALERITKLGRLGEDLVAERLDHHGYTKIENLNLRRRNYPFGDLLATKDGIQYFIGVKARNEMRQGNVGLNESYNLVLIRDALNKQLKNQGKTTDQITTMLLDEVSKLAADLDATPAWATVSIRPREGTYSAYFGLVERLGIRRSVPMTPKECARYDGLARDLGDSRITLDLLNA
jgi:Holliday junction resolvase-like predicted endonuclease